jgi:hypothetical protein
MRSDVPTQVGIGFTIVVAAATFLVAVMAGLFLIWQPDARTLTQVRNAPSQLSFAAPADVRRAPPRSLGATPETGQ